MQHKPSYRPSAISLFLAWLSLSIVVPLRADDAIPTALQDFVARPESVFAWEVKDRQKSEQGTVYDVDLTSQEWQGIVWKHVVQIFEPAQLEDSRHVLLFVSGGSIGQRPGRESLQMGLGLASLTGARVAMLYQVPNQPLLGGRKEDDLITETWLRYLNTGDERWPLLFPMVKSAVKAMDALQALGKQQWNTTVDGFVITGGSKRGWTSWLTPVVDKRVIATAPMVIDVLNFRAQMQHQLDTWGVYSEQIHDYSSKGLIKPGDETPREITLRRMMDPYTYVKQLTLPKLLIHGTNDRYWVVDATKFYWDDVPEPKYMLKVPNAGHGLDGGRDLAFKTLAVFFRHACQNVALPSLKSSYEGTGSEVIVRIDSSATPIAVNVWTATTQNKDFRESKWTSRTMEKSGESFVAHVAFPAEGHVAHFAEARFESGKRPFSLCTLVRVDGRTPFGK